MHAFILRLNVVIIITRHSTGNIILAHVAKNAKIIPKTLTTSNKGDNQMKVNCE